MTNHIKLLYLPPHTSHLLEHVDLAIFGNVKQRIRKYNNKHQVANQSAQICQILESHHESCTTMKIVSAFSQSGIELELNDHGSQICKVNIDKARVVSRQMEFDDKDKQLFPNGVILQGPVIVTEDNVSSSHPDESDNQNFSDNSFFE